MLLHWLFCPWGCAVGFAISFWPSPCTEHRPGVGQGLPEQSAPHQSAHLVLKHKSWWLSSLTCHSHINNAFYLKKVRALLQITSTREDCFCMRLTTEMTSNPKQVSSGKLSCLKNLTCFVPNFTAFAPLGSFPAKTLGFLSKLVLLECVWVYQVFMYVGHLFLPMSNRSEHVCEWLEMHGHELKPNGFSPKTISNELGEEKINNNNKKKKVQQPNPERLIEKKMKCKGSMEPAQYFNLGKEFWVVSFFGVYPRGLGGKGVLYVYACESGSKTPAIPVLWWNGVNSSNAWVT